MTDIDDSDIVVQDSFRESFPAIMNILPSEALDVARNPDAQEVIEVGEGNALLIRISLSRPNAAKPYYLLVLDSVDENGMRVLHDAFKFFEDLCAGITEKTPMELLTAVADRFAYKVQPGGEAKKLILKESFPCAPEDVNTETIIRLMMPIDMNKGEEVQGTQYVTYDPIKQSINFALAFVWNATRYRQYLASAN